MFVSNILPFLLLLVVNSTMLTEGIRRRHHRDTSTDLQAEENQFLAQYTRLVQKWSCSDPRPRLVYLEEEHQSLINANSKWIPHAVSLFRCEPSFGLCLPYTPGRTCQPSSTEPVTLLLKKFDGTRGRYTTYPVTFTNHTKCACAP